MKKGKLENKMIWSEEDKGTLIPPAPLSPGAESAPGERGSEEVKIRMRPGRALEGAAGPGESAVVSRQMAEYLISIGYALKEE